MPRRKTTTAATWALGIAGTAFMASPLLAADTASPVATAKTIQVHEVYEQGAPGTTGLAPLYNFDVRFERPSKMKILLFQARDKTGKAPHQYVNDGKIEREYNANENTFTVIAPGPKGESHSQIRGMSMVDKILTSNAKPSEAGAVRSTSTETIDGQIYTVISDKQQPRKEPGNRSYVITEKMWVNAKTHLPFKDSFVLTENGKSREIGRLTFSNWVFNKPIPASLIAWNAPADAKPYAEPKLLAAGAPAPDFTVLTSDGKTAHLSDFKGKPVVLDFWATWCTPCQASMPHLNKVYTETKDQGVQVLAVCVWDKKPAYDKWLTEKGPTYAFPTYFDTATSNAQSFATTGYGVTGIPTQYVIDKDGNIAACNVGYDDGDHRLEDELVKLGVNIPKTTASAKTN